MTNIYIVEETFPVEGTTIDVWGRDKGGIFDDLDMAKQALYSGYAFQRTLYKGRFEKGILIADSLIETVMYSDEKKCLVKVDL